MTTAPDGLPPLGEVIRRHGLAARKGLGQNFILDLNLTRRIARAAGPLDGVTVVEVGPGPGGLTRGLLLEGAGKVVAIERDRRCIPALEEIARRYPDRLEIVEADAVNTDFAALASPPARIVANLPYSAGSELLALWLTAEPWPPWYDRMVLMFQREVAERIVAPSGSRTYGRLSVLAQWRTEARIVLRLPPRAFTPAPKVESALVDLIPRADSEPAGSSAALQQLTAAAFGQRRKMLRSSLKAKIQDPVKLMEKIGIDPSLRAENLSVSQFCALARAWHEEHCGRDGSQL